MDAYVFQAALLCDDCAQKVFDELHDTGASNYDDSEHWPQGPYSNGGGEADCPQHCDRCNVILQNPLTNDGYEYVAEQIDNYRPSDVLREWARFYHGENDKLDRTIDESKILEGVS